MIKSPMILISSSVALGDEFSDPSVSLSETYQRALMGDPISAFGGIVACNRPVDAELARAMRASVSPSSGQRMLYEIIVAPGFSEEAMTSLTRWRNCRILEVPVGDALPYDLRRVSGGYLLQEPDRKPDESLELKVASKREP